MTRLSTLFAAALCASACLAACQAQTLPAGDSKSLASFGAVGDGKTLNTVALQNTIDQLAASGGGTLDLPEGTFLSGALFLKPGVNLHLQKGAVLKGTTDIKQYPRMRTRIEGHFQEWIPALVNADHVDHLTISGEGSLDGSGEPFWTEFWTRYRADKKTKNLDVERPRLIFIENSNDVHVSGIHLLNSAFWNLHVYKCSDVTIDGLNVKSGADSPSTDGTDIDSSQNVEIKNCTYDVNDDCIALKGSKGPLAMEDKESPPVEHIHISNCTFVHGQGVLTLGSEATVVRDVVVEHCTVAGPLLKGLPIVRLKLRPDTPQDYEDLHFKDITADGDAVIIAVRPWTQYFDLQGHEPPTRTVKNVTVSGIRGTFRSLGVIHGNKGDVIDGITLEDIDVKVKNAKPEIVGVTNLVVKDVKLNGEPYTGP